MSEVLYRFQRVMVLKTEKAGAQNPRILIRTPKGTKWVFKSDTKAVDSEIPF